MPIGLPECNDDEAAMFGIPVMKCMEEISIRCEYGCLQGLSLLHKVEIASSDEPFFCRTCPSMASPGKKLADCSGEILVQ